jgi:hypothetical protein
MSDIIEVVSDDAVSTVIEVIERGPQGPAGSGGGGGVDPIPSNTILGNNTGSTALATGLTVTQAMTLLGAIGNTFETVSQNLKAYATGFTYVDGRVTSVTYTVPSVGIAQKIINYTGNKITSIVLANVVGEALPSGISLTKTYTYTGDNVTGVAYS